MKNAYKKRPHYINIIKPFIGSDLIKVIIGQRRAGKSYILLQLIDEIKKSDPQANIIYINKEDNQYSDIDNHQRLISYVEDKIKKTGKNYLFIDEVQDISNFEKSLRHFTFKKNVDIYCTGSNSKLLSSEIATGLSGRYIEIAVHPLSYREFLDFHSLEKGEDSLLKYIKYGGLPYISNLKLEDDIVYGYLKSVYNTIVLKDVVARFNIRNINFLNRLVEYISDNIGSLVSAKKISDFLKSQKIKTTPNKILDYLSYLCSSFVIRDVARADIKGKKIFEINEKYYFEDLGIRHALQAYNSSAIGQVLENLVYGHLIRLGFKVNVGQLEGKEIDFVAEKNGKRLYFQVAYLIVNQETRKREFGNLLEIKDNYPKVVISMDKLITGDYKGIKHYHVIDFLMMDKF